MTNDEVVDAISRLEWNLNKKFPEIPVPAHTSNDKSVMPYTDICPDCGEKMVSSKSTSSTYVAYISPKGHRHNDNCVTRKFSCKNGHKLKVSTLSTCPACDWTGKSDCDCHDFEKLEKWPDE